MSDEQTSLIGSFKKAIGSGASEVDILKEEFAAEVRMLKEQDSVTGLCSKKSFWEKFNKKLELENNNKFEDFALLMLDLSRFHIVNETMGYDVGNEMLRAVGKRLEESLPNESGRIISRLYGNTFAILLWNTKPSEAVSIAKRILNGLLPPFRMDTNHVHVTSCIGISHYPVNAKDSNTLMLQAESALLEAKENGENSFHAFSSEMEMDSIDRLKLENYLHQALDKKEFRLVFQPQMAISERRVSAVEALLRWESRDLGSTVSPAKFIPILQETGLIVPVGEWIMRESLTRCKEWNKKYPWMKVAVNINGHQIKHKNFVQSCIDILKEVGIDAKHLILDLQESSISKESKSTIDTLTQLHNMGIHLAIDDFGVGMTSFHQLKKMPVDTMKIDPTFLQDIEKKPEENEPMVDALISMAKSLKLSIVGEGVETEYQMNFLRQHGCHHMQGYFFCKPLPFNDVSIFLDKFNPQ